MLKYVNRHSFEGLIDGGLAANEPSDWETLTALNLRYLRLAKVG